MYDSKHGDAMETGRDPGGRSVRGWGILFLAMLVIIPMAAVHRLALALDRLLFPDLRKIQLRKPLFVVGLPRSGTTLTHRLVATQSDTFTSMPLWELLFAPAVSQKVLFGCLYRVDQRLGGLVTKLLDACFSLATRTQQGVHPTSLFSVEEDALGLLAHDGCFLRVLAFPHSVYSWQLGKFSELSAARRRALLAAYDGIVRRHLRFRGEERTFLSKTPGFIAWKADLEALYPDAHFLVTNREPTTCLASQLSSVEDEIRLFGFAPDSKEIAESFLDLFSHYYRAVVEVERQEPSSNSRLLQYPELCETPFTIIQEAMSEWQFSTTDDDLARLKTACQKTATYRSQHRYRLEDYSLDPHQTAAHFELVRRQVHQAAAPDLGPVLDATAASRTPSSNSLQSSDLEDEKDSASLSAQAPPLVQSSTQS